MAQVAQKMACSSQLTYARCGEVGSAARTAADSYVWQSMSASGSYRPKQGYRKPRLRFDE